MSVFPDLSNYGYAIEAELGCNREGGRITWKGIDLNSQKTVAIKQFCFAQANASWSGYKAYAREIEILKNLDHPCIPKYLDSVETETGFCLIQEYILAKSCGYYQPLSVAEVKRIAFNVLDILIYLQQQSVPILHQDIKPDNILLDESLNAYLVDFGFSRLGVTEVAGSSVFKGTPGFIAPEQIIRPTTASDIYSLGITLVFLLTNKTITEITALASMDDPYQLVLPKLLPNLERPFLQWLETMTCAKVSRRFQDAVSAKEALLKIESPRKFSDKSVVNNLSLSILVEPKIAWGTVGIFSLAIASVWGLNFAANRVELTPAKITIAILAAIAIGITQLGAAAIAGSDRQARSQGLVLSIIMPGFLVATSAAIWGIKQAVVITAATNVAEILLLFYCWWQIPSTRSRTIVKGSLGLTAIAIGITLGIKLT